MIRPEERQDSRRRFLWTTACLGLVGRAAREPFDSLPAGAWQHARQNGLVMLRFPAPSRLSWQTQIARSDEPGEPLVVSGRVFAPDGRTPASGVTVYAYNTDAQGYYGENHKEYPPRIYGWMKTDPAGRFELRTIRPGHYPDMRIPAHIHFSLWGAGYPPQWAEELRFQGDPYLTEAVAAEDAQRGPFRTIQPLVRDGGLWRCEIKIRLARETNFR